MSVCSTPASGNSGAIMNLVSSAVTAYNGVSKQAGGNLESDVQWIGQISAGDTIAFEKLCRAYQNRVFGYLFRMLGSRDGAEEVLNEVFLGIWQGASRFKGDASPATWIFRIARNRAVTRLSKSSLATCDDDNIGEMEDVRDGAEENLVRRNLIHAGLKKLSREHREVVEMTFFLGLSYKEIATVVDCPVNTVKTRMFHAKQQLRMILERTTRGVS